MSALIELPVPGEDDLHAAVADRLPGVTSAQVRQVLERHGVRLARPLPARRSLLVHRLYCEGVKVGTEENDGSFAIDLEFGPGSWVIASDENSAGKSNLLWALSWALRGESFEEYRRPETVGWFHYIRVDAEVAGVPISVRATFDGPNAVSVELLTSDAVEHLLALSGRDGVGEQVRVAASAKDAASAKELIGRFMCDRLGLRPLSACTAEPGAPREADGSRDSQEHVHGWSSFFHVVALNAGHDRVLLGPTQFGALPARLMQVFLDVPYVAELSEVGVAAKQLKQARRHERRRHDEDLQARRQRIEPLQRDLAAAQARLTAVSQQAPDVRGLLTEVEDAARLVRVRRAARDELADVLAATRKERIRDQRALKWARESAAARMMLGALDPQVCPRCDTAITDERRAEENTRHRCSVCTSTLALPQESPDDQAEALSRLEERLQASRAAEEQARQAADQAEAELTQARARHETAEQALHQVRSADWYSQREEALAALHRLQGALELVEADLSAPDTDTQQSPDLDLQVLEALERELRTIVAQRCDDLFRDVSDELVRLARQLGVTNLTSVDLNVNGHLNARKSGVRTAYKDFSPGERLRMRIAAVVAMITVGHRHGIASHPGLLLIDAPIAEEVVPGDAEQVLTALRHMTDSVEGMQLIITSMNEAVHAVFPQERIIRSSCGPGGRYMF